MNEIIEMLEVDRRYYQKWKNFGIENGISNAMIIYYSTILMYIDSLIARMEARLKVGSE